MQKWEPLSLGELKGQSQVHMCILHLYFLWDLELVYDQFLMVQNGSMGTPKTRGRTIAIPYSFFLLFFFFSLILIYKI